MKRIAVLLLTLLVGLSASGARPSRVKPNYDLASQFSQKRISQMVFSTSLQPNWFRHSDKFWYVWKTPEGTQYWIVDPETGRKSQVFDMEKLAMEVTAIVRDPFDAQHLPIEKLELKDDQFFRFDIKSSQEVPDTLAEKRAAREKKDGDKAAKGPEKPKMTKKVYHFQYEIATGRLSEYKPEKEEYPAWASVSPDGQTGVYVKNANLFWMDKENLAKAAEDDKDSTLVEHRLTSDGIRQYGYGGDNYMGDTETDTTRRVRAGSVVWSPDSKHFVAVKTDMREIKDFWVINSLSQPRPTLETYKYQMPGEPGPKEELYVFSMPDGGRKRYRVNAFKDQTMDVSVRPRKYAETYSKFRSRVWLGDNDGFYLSRGSRDLHRIDVCRVDLAGDSTRTVISERMNTYVEERQLRTLAGGKQLLWWSERNGWANLYLYNADGTLVRNLTDGAYHVEDVLEVNEKEGYVLFSACGVNKGENPYQMHTYRVSLSGGPIKQLDMDDMNVDAIASDDGRWAVGNCSRVDYAPEAWLLGRDGKRTLLEKADLSLLYAAGYKMPERFKVKAADGVTDLYGAIRSASRSRPPTASPTSTARCTSRSTSTPPRSIRSSTTSIPARRSRPTTSPGPRAWCAPTAWRRWASSWSRWATAAAIPTAPSGTTTTATATCATTAWRTRNTPSSSSPASMTSSTAPAWASTATPAADSCPRRPSSSIPTSSRRPSPAPATTTTASTTAGGARRTTA